MVIDGDELIGFVVFVLWFGMGWFEVLVVSELCWC